MDTHPDENYDEKIEKMVALTVAGAKGLIPVGQVALPLTQIAQGDLAPPEARDFAQALLRILKGERDPIALVEELTPELAEVVWETLEQIEAPLPEVDQAIPDPLAFEELIEKVAGACAGEILLWQQLWHLTGQLASDQTCPPQIQRLGAVLRRILAGERQKHILTELSSEHRWAVEQLLDWLRARAVEPKSRP